MTGVKLIFVHMACLLTFILLLVTTLHYKEFFDSNIYATATFWLFVSYDGCILFQCARF